MISYFITSAILLTVFLVLYKLLLEREKMHHFNRFYLIGALIIGLTAPLITFEISTNSDLANDVMNLKETVVEAPAQQLEEAISPSSNEATVTNPDEQPEMVMDAEPVEEAGTNWIPIFFGIYGLVTFALLIRFVWNIRFLLKQAYNHSAAKWKDAELVLLEDDIPPYSFMNYIYLNKQSYDSGEISDRVLHHELTHIQQKHSFDLLFIEILRAVFWLNPAIHFFRPAIQLNHEFLADDAVIQMDQEQAEYQKELLKFAEAKTPDVVNTINYSLTKKRFNMMVKKTTNKLKVFKISTLIPIISASLLVYCVNVTESVETELISHSTLKEFKGHIILSTFGRSYPDVKLFISEEGVYANTETYFFDENDELYTGIQIWKYHEIDHINRIYEFVDGRLIKATYYYDSGQEMRREEFERRENYNLRTSFIDGQLKAKYEDIVEDNGLKRVFRHSDSQGRVKSLGIMISNENGALIENEYYKDGVLINHNYMTGNIITRKEFFDDGKLKGEYSYRADGNSLFGSARQPIQYEGVMVRYNEDGTLFGKEIYDNGVLIEKIK